jgi:hypothetical protein
LDFPQRNQPRQSILGRIEQKLDSALDFLIAFRVERSEDPMTGIPDHNFHTSNTQFIVMMILIFVIGLCVGGLLLGLSILGL